MMEGRKDATKIALAFARDYIRAETVRLIVSTAEGPDVVGHTLHAWSQVYEDLLEGRYADFPDTITLAAAYKKLSVEEVLHNLEDQTRDLEEHMKKSIVVLSEVADLSISDATIRFWTTMMDNTNTNTYEQ